MNIFKKIKNDKKQVNENTSDLIDPPSDIQMNGKHLICDDAYTNRLVLQKYLTLFGCKTDEAQNGQDAISNVMDNGTYNIIWMDLKMPKMDGFEATEHLRKNLQYKGTIIGLTGYVDEVTVKRCYDLGMTHVVPKPFDKAVIKNYCEIYK